MKPKNKRKNRKIWEEEAIHSFHAPNISSHHIAYAMELGREEKWSSVKPALLGIIWIASNSKLQEVNNRSTACFAKAFMS
jgi:hypothetical protein